MYDKQIFLINEEVKKIGLSDKALDKFFVAGGALTSVFSNKKINDLDLFFYDKWKYDDLRSEMGEKDWKPVFESDSAVSYNINGVRFQLIKKVFGTPEEVIKNFDFSVCMCACTLAPEKKIIMDDNFLYHLAQRTLYFNINAKYPISSLWRVKKYLKKDFTFPAIEAIKISLAINNLNIKSYIDLKEQLEGIDTLFLADLTDALLLKKDAVYDFREAIEYMNDILSKKLGLED